MDKIKKSSNRIHFLDELRGFAVFCMVFYHAFFIIGDFFEFKIANELFEFFMPVEPMFAGLFIAICGISCSLSRSNLKRGLILLGIALGMSAVTVGILPRFEMDGLQIKFGILHFLSVAILFYSLVQKRVNKFNPYVGIILCTFLYPFTSGIEQGRLSFGELLFFNIPSSLYTTDWLMPFGIYSKSFFSGDYFPIFPNIFIFFAGVFIGRYFSAVNFPEWTYKKRCGFFSFLGRKALIIYVAHMPIIFGLSYIINYLINLR